MLFLTLHSAPVLPYALTNFYASPQNKLAVTRAPTLSTLNKTVFAGKIPEALTYSNTRRADAQHCLQGSTRLKNRTRGSCQCGNVTYSSTESPLFCVVCHCKDCQKLSAAAFSPTVVIRAKTFSVSGELSRFESKADSGTTKHAYFCPRCGNRIYHSDPGAPEFVRLKAGTLDGMTIPAPVAHVWVSRKQPWVDIPADVAQFEGNVEDMAEVLRNAKSRE